MKANKALKRIAEVEELTSDVMRRLSKAAPQVSKLLKDLKAAVARVKEALSAQVSSRAAKKKAAPARKKAAKKKVAKASKAKPSKKVARVKRAAKKPASKRRTPAPVQSAEATVQEPMPAMDSLTKSELQ